MQKTSSLDIETTDVLFDKSVSSPAENRYVFTHRMTFKNTGTSAAKVLGRHWVITNSDGKEFEVHGISHFSEQLYLAPGASATIRCETTLNTPVGSIEGSYQFFSDNDKLIEEKFLPIRLAAETLH